MGATAAAWAPSSTPPLTEPPEAPEAPLAAKCLAPFCGVHAELPSLWREAGGASRKGEQWGSIKQMQCQVGKGTFGAGVKGRVWFPPGVGRGGFPERRHFPWAPGSCWLACLGFCFEGAPAGLLHVIASHLFTQIKREKELESLRRC